MMLILSGPALNRDRLTAVPTPLKPPPIMLIWFIFDKCSSQPRYQIKPSVPARIESDDSQTIRANSTRDRMLGRRQSTCASIPSPGELRASSFRRQSSVAMLCFEPAYVSHSNRILERIARDIGVELGK